MKVKVLIVQSRLTLCDPMASIAYQALQSVEFSRQEYWSGLPFLIAQLVKRPKGIA